MWELWVLEETDEAALVVFEWKRVHPAVAVEFDKTESVEMRREAEEGL